MSAIGDVDIGLQSDDIQLCHPFPCSCSVLVDGQTSFKTFC